MFDTKLSTVGEKYKSWIEIQENNNSDIQNLKLKI